MSSALFNMKLKETKGLTFNQFFTPFLTTFLYLIDFLLDNLELWARLNSHDYHNSLKSLHYWDVIPSCILIKYEYISPGSIKIILPRSHIRKHDSSNDKCGNFPLCLRHNVFCHATALLIITLGSSVIY